jgi:tetratricopeptide (TPR) repeat protein
MLALVELAEAKKVDKSQRHIKFIRSFEYASIAHHLAPKHELTLNYLSNYYFCTWHVIDTGIHCQFLDGLNIQIKYKKSNIHLTTNIEKFVLLGNMIRIQKTIQNVITGKTINEENVPNNNNDILNAYENVEPYIICVITLQTEISNYEELNYNNINSEHNKNLLIETMDTLKVKEYASEAFQSTNVPEIKSESAYLLGRLFHMLGKFEAAYQLYNLAQQQWPENALALFGLGQLQLSQHAFQQALEYFESVLKIYPDDKDTQCYLILIKSLSKKEITPFEKLQQVATSFAFEIDIWLAQAQIRHQKGPSEYKHALKCYECALQCIENSKKVPHSNLLLNIAIIHHYDRRLTEAKKYIRRSLELIASEQEQQPHLTDKTDYKIYAYENDMFYQWSNTSINITIDCVNGLKTTFRLLDETRKSDLLEYIKIDERVVINNTLYTVLDISEDMLTFTCYSLVSQQNHIGENYELLCKKNTYNISNEYLAHFYTYGRIMEDCGYSQAATEIYIAILKEHPSFNDCYIRLSIIATDMGNLTDAMSWINRSLIVDPGHVDSMIAQADLLCHMNGYSDALKKYDTVLHQVLLLRQ